MPVQTLDAQMQVCRVDDVLDADMDGEIVMMNIEQGRYFGLNQTGTRIWAMLAHPIVINDLCSQLATEFNVLPQKCGQEVMSFLENLLNRGLLKIVRNGSHQDL